ncbi:MAG: rhodanese-like domain-containing protein [Proteobacteria bacterium]|nr:rhodanese-like domain-containing protein [Pseudomonadota bacterium]
MSSESSKIETLEPSEVSQLLEENRVLLIDVREPDEFAAERIRGALLHPLSTFNAQVIPADGIPRVIFHCAGGRRSLAAAEKHLGAGHLRAAHMAGGIAAWKAAGLPVIVSGT